MTLQSSGAISISQINAEFGRGNNLNAYRGTTWYTDAGGSGTFSSGAISMSEFYGKRATPAFTVGYDAYFGNGTGFEYSFTTGQPAGIGIRFNANGTIDQFTYSRGYFASGSYWGNPATSGIGSNYWVRFTRTATAGPSAGSYSTASTGWLQLNTGREVVLQKSTGFNGMSATYTIEISSSSSGSPVLTTRTGITLTTTDSLV